MPCSLFFIIILFAKAFKRISGKTKRNPYKKGHQRTNLTDIVCVSCPGDLSANCCQVLKQTDKMVGGMKRKMFCFSQILMIKKSDK